MTSAIVPNVLIDSSGWLHYFMKTQKGKKFYQLIITARPEKYVTPTMVIFEVYKKVLREYGEEKASEAIGYIRDRTTLIPLDETIAVRAAEISIEKKHHLADAVICATAETYDARIYTADMHFKGMENVEIL